MKRCSLCGNRIWPWHRVGFRVGRVGTWFFHTKCYHAAASRIGGGS